MTRPNDKSATLAGFLMLFGAVFSITWLFILVSGIIDPKIIIRYILIASPLPWLVLDVAFGGNSAAASILALLFLSGIVLSFAGGIAAIRRKARPLALIGSVGLLVTVPILGVAAFILIIRGKFTNRQMASPSRVG